MYTQAVMVFDSPIPDREGKEGASRRRFALTENQSVLSIYDIREQIKIKKYSVIVEKCPETGLFIGYVPRFPEAHSQGETMDELNKNFKEVIEMLFEEGERILESQFIGIQNVMVA